MAWTSGAPTSVEHGLSVGCFLSDDPWLQPISVEVCLCTELVGPALSTSGDLQLPTAHAIEASRAELSKNRIPCNEMPFHIGRILGYGWSDCSTMISCKA